LWNDIMGEVKEITKVYLNCPYGQFVFSSYNCHPSGSYIVIRIFYFFSFPYISNT